METRRRQLLREQLHCCFRVMQQLLVVQLYCYYCCWLVIVKLLQLLLDDRLQLSQQLILRAGQLPLRVSA